MKTKPWPIVILALIQLMAPLSNVLFSAWLHQISVARYLSLFFETRSALELTEFFGIYAVTAFAIFSVRSWSYPVFLAIMGWTFYRNYQSWQAHPDIFTVPMMLTVHAVNLGLVSYFLLPAVRAAYFNPKLRWWESKPRYRIDLLGQLVPHQGILSGSECHILDISEGGVLIKSNAKLTVGDNLQLKFSFFSLHFALPAKIVHQGGSQFQGYGLQFVALSREQKRQIRNLTRAFALIGLQERSERVMWHEDFAHWVGNLFRTGRGWVPQLPQRGVQGVGSGTKTENSETRKAA